MIKLVAQSSALDLSHLYVMGILNVMPDPLSDNGAHNSLVEVVKRVNLIINARTTIIDIGGEPTRPGAAEVSVEEELARMTPVIEAIAQHFEAWISVDMSKPKVIHKSARAGAHTINDIRSLTEPDAPQAAAETGLSVCLMYIQGQPKTIQKAPEYENISADVGCSFAEHTVCHKQAGITKEKLLFGPGFGSDKNPSHNYQLLARLGEFHHFRLPLLVGMSWKSMVGQLLSVGPSGRLNGSLTCIVIAAMQGTQMIRVRNVKETVEALRVVEATLAAKGKKRYE